jgi:hypothetical protein
MGTTKVDDRCAHLPSFARPGVFKNINQFPRCPRRRNALEGLRPGRMDTKYSARPAFTKGVRRKRSSNFYQ